MERTRPNVGAARRRLLLFAICAAANAITTTATGATTWDLLWKAKPVAPSSSSAAEQSPLEQYRSLLEQEDWSATRCTSRAADQPGRKGGAPFVFMHMPKAAGSSVQAMLRRSAGRSNLTHCLLDHLSDWPAMAARRPRSKGRKRLRRAPKRGASCQLERRTRAAADNITVLYGHSWWNMPRRRWERRGPLRAVLLRDPLSAAASLYSYARAQKTLWTTMASAPPGSPRHEAWTRYTTNPKTRGARGNMPSVGRWPTFGGAVRFTCASFAARQRMLAQHPRSAVECTFAVGAAAKKACLANKKLPRGFYNLVSWWMCGNEQCPDNLDLVMPSCARAGTPCGGADSSAYSRKLEAQLQQAAEHLLQTDVVGTTENVPGFVAELERHLDWFNPRKKLPPRVDPLARAFADLGVSKAERRANFSAPRPVATPEDEACLRRMLQPDMELFRLAQAIVAFRKERCGRSGELHRQ